MGAVIAGALIVEGAARVLRPLADSPEHRFWRYDPELGWSHHPNEQGVFESERVGYRGAVKLDSIGARDNQNGVRGPFARTILVVGDSVTAGFEVDGNQTFCSLLEKKLSRDGKRYRVVNAGVRGYGTDQAYWMAKRLIPIVKPDIVLYLYVWNDLTDNVTIKNFYRDYSKPVFVLDGAAKLRTLNLPAATMPKGSYDFAYFDRDVKHVTGEFDTSGPIDWLRGHLRSYETLEVFYYRYFIQPYTALPNYGRIDERYRENLFSAILERMKEESPRLVVAAFVSNQRVWTYKAAVAKRTARELGIEFVDLSPSFASGSEEFIFPKDGHWNVRGHQAAADALYGFFRSARIDRSR